MRFRHTNNPSHITLYPLASCALSFIASSTLLYSHSSSLSFHLPAHPFQSSPKRQTRTASNTRVSCNKVKATHNTQSHPLALSCAHHQPAKSPPTNHPHCLSNGYTMLLTGDIALCTQPTAIQQQHKQTTCVWVSTNGFHIPHTSAPHFLFVAPFVTGAREDPKYTCQQMYIM